MKNSPSLFRLKKKHTSLSNNDYNSEKICFLMGEILSKGMSPFSVMI